MYSIKPESINCNIAFPGIKRKIDTFPLATRDMVTNNLLINLKQAKHFLLTAVSIKRTMSYIFKYLSEI